MKCFLFFCFNILLSTAFECPSSDWFRFRNKCFLTGGSEWYTIQENVKFCESQSATTVSIHSEEENQFIETKLKPGYGYMLGIRQVNFNVGTYTWLDGSPYNFSQWVRRDGTKSCAGAYIFESNWYDETNCKARHIGFCQIDFDTPSDFMRLPINQRSHYLYGKIKTNELQLNDTNAKLDATNDLLRNMRLAFEAKLNAMDLKINGVQAEISSLMEFINQTKYQNETHNGNVINSMVKNMNQTYTLDWNFQINFLFIFCILIILICKILN